MTAQTRSGLSRAFVVGFASLLTIACDRSPLEVAKDDLAVAEARWTAAALRNYDFQIRRSCFCGSVPLIAVTVRNGVPTSAIDVDTGMPIDTAQFSDFLTVDRVFALLREYTDREPATFNATYDAQLGFPQQVYIDPVRNAVDEELSIVISALVAR
jgi:hypothetical protein